MIMFVWTIKNTILIKFYGIIFLNIMSVTAKLYENKVIGLINII